MKRTIDLGCYGFSLKIKAITEALIKLLENSWIVRKKIYRDAYTKNLYDPVMLGDF